MATRFHSISGEIKQELLAAGDNINVSKISLTNIHATNPCTVDLYIEKKLTGKFYLLKEVELPIGNSLVYNNMKFNNKSDEFGLYIKLNKSATETPSVDVILE